METAPENLKICIVGASGKLGQYMVRRALDRGYEVVHEAPAIVGRQMPSALAHATASPAR